MKTKYLFLFSIGGVDECLRLNERASEHIELNRRATFQTRKYLFIFIIIS